MGNPKRLGEISQPSHAARVETEGLTRPAPVGRATAGIGLM